MVADGTAGRPTAPTGALGRVSAQLSRKEAEGVPTSESSAWSTAKDAPYVTVIVPTVGRLNQLQRCLQSLQGLTYPRFDVLVVDNRPADSTRLAIESEAGQDSRISYLAEPRPGLSIARNSGVANTTAEIVAFTDDDVVVDSRWLDAVVEPFVEDQSVGAVTGLVLPLELETQAQSVFETYRGFGRGSERRVFDLEHRVTDKLFYPYWGGVFGSGNNMAFRRSFLRSIGGFDPALGAGSIARSGEDVEALSRLVFAGYKIVYEPRAMCWHAHRRDFAGLRRQMFDYGVGFTAILTKWLLRRPSFSIALLAAIPKVFRGASPARPGRQAGLPMRLRMLEILGYLAGPVQYARSVHRVRRLRPSDPVAEDDVVDRS
jgi:GT2 family glycosyltransferase